MNIRADILAVLVLFIFCADLTPAAPVSLKVQPMGTNQVELTLGSLETNAYYQVMVRSNSPDGHWIVFTSLLSGSNSTITSIHDLSGVSGLSLNTFSHWTFVAGRWEDALGDEFPMIYKELVLRMDPYAPADPYGDPMGDGWNNMQKMQSNMDPYRAYAPHEPKLSVKFMVGTNDPRHGNAVLTWQIFGGPIPDFVLIERTNRTFHPATNNFRYPQRPPGFNGRFPTNRPPNIRPPFGPPGSQNRGEWVVGSFTAVGRVPGQVPKNGYAEYRYIDANVDEFAQPAYRIAPHYTPPFRAVLKQVDTAAIRKTIIHVTAEPTTNGYALTVPNPIPYAWYLLLVRDKNNPTWRASGYFMSGTNREPVHLLVDKKGMQHDGQSPIAMPEVRFLPEVIGPEFVAGWGEDSDGDGLPDVYEVLVTHTDPDNADTDNTGVLDGYKDMGADGWTTLEKFRRRVDPLRTARPPATVEQTRPTEREIMNAVMPKTDLACNLQIAFRTNGATDFQPAERVPWMLTKIMNFRQQDERKDFDIRISWEFAEPQPGQFTTYPFGEEPAFHPLEVLTQKFGVQLAESFKRNLEANPPLSNIDASNLTAQLLQGYHQGGRDGGSAMQEMMLIQDNLSQDFYGKVVDQYGKPVAGAEVTAQVNVMMGRGTPQKTQTEANGLFQFTGIRGRSLDVTLAKEGHQIQGHGLGTKGQNGAETSPTKRCVYTMWKLKGPEPMIHDSKRYPLNKPDDRVYTVDLLSKSITDGTNGAGDLYVQFKRPPEVKPRDNFNWSFSMTALGGGLIEVTNDDYLNEAPAKGYLAQYKLDMTPADAKWRGEEGTFYLKSRRGQVYGHIHIRLDPVYRDGAMLEIESFINPAGSRNLEFDPAKETQYTPKAAAVAPAPVPSTPNASVVPHVVALTTAASNQASDIIYRCITIGGLHGAQGAVDGTNTASRFNQPWGIAADRDGSVYVAEWGNSTIRKLHMISSNWVVSTIVGIAGKAGSADGTNAEARLNHPHGIVTDNSGNLYFADTFNNTIRSITHNKNNWVVTTIAGRSGVFGSNDGTNSDAQFNNPGGITMDRHGDLFVSDVANNTIRKLTPVGSGWAVTTIAGLTGNIQESHVFHPAYGSADGTNSDARFFAPFGVAADSHGDLYVTDYENSTIRKVTQSGTNWVVTTVAGLAEQSGYVDGTNGTTRFDHPRAIAIDQDDNIYVDDTGTDTIRLIKHVGTNYVVKTIVGLPWRWGYADGTNNTPQFDSSSGIALDGVGNIYLADTGNDAIRQIVSPNVPKYHARWIVWIIISLGCMLAWLLAIGRRRLPLRKDPLPALPAK